MDGKFRLQLEQTIIGSCILENGYSQVAEVLTDKSFTKSEPFDHQLIFSAIEKLYPVRPIDLLTVSYEINKPEYSSYLAHCALNVSSASNLKHHAYILLQLGMRDALINLLDQAQSTAVSLVTRSAIQEVIDECLDTENDILDIYSKVVSYLENLGVENNIVNQVQTLNEKFLLKVSKIKAQSHIDSLLNNLMRIGNNHVQTNARLAISHLGETIKAIISRGEVSKETLNKILQL